MMAYNIVSMGCACGVARSMEKYGLRQCSGPFDWYVSKFSSLLHFMETDFSDFLNRKNIKISSRPNEFYDEKYDCYFANEITYDFDDEWDSVYNKYQRRIKRFQQITKSPTYFIRCIRDEDEEKYIYENYEYILSIIKEQNDLNEIIFLGRKDSVEGFPFKYFPIGYQVGDCAYNIAIGNNWLFDRNYDILKFLCGELPEERIIKNLFFYRKKFAQNELVIRDRYAMAVKLLQCKEEEWLTRLPEHIIIYGGGVIGKALYDKCKKFCSVESFVDRHPNASNYDGVKIVHYTDIVSLKGKNFVITPIYDIQKISKIISKYKPDANIIPLDKILI